VLLALHVSCTLQNFSIGFGPKLLSFKSGRGVRIGGKDDDDSSSSTAASMPVDEHVEYALRLIPVGGFVSFPVNFEQDEEGVITEDDHPDLLQVNLHSGYSECTAASEACIVCWILAIIWSGVYSSVAFRELRTFCHACVRAGVQLQ
jgi:membrane-associated protease RseP (regulator of RpoE activity)